MKPARILTSLAAITALGAASEPTSPDLVAQLLAIERDNIHAYVTHDTARLDRNLAAEYVHTNLIGQRETKGEEIAEFKPGGAFTLAAGTIDHAVARRYGDVAVLRADVRWTGASYRPPDRPAVDVSGVYSVTRTYVWRDGRWQLAASHASRQPPPR